MLLFLHLYVDSGFRLNRQALSDNNFTNGTGDDKGPCECLAVRIGQSTSRLTMLCNQTQVLVFFAYSVLYYLLLMVDCFFHCRFNFLICESVVGWKECL